MAEVTVSELAKSVGASVDRLLTQMGQAGLPHTSAEDKVSDSEKQTLLGFLKTAGGAAAPGPKKITLKRKTTTTLKMGSGSARKTVNVEVRKKRTYVKRTDLDVEPDASELELAGAAPEGVAPTPAEPEYLPETPPEVPEIDPAPEIEPAAPEPEIVPEPEPEPAPEVPEVPPEPELPEVETPTPTPSAAPAPSRYAFVDDIEQRRIAAIAARRQAESVAAEAAKRAQEERKRREEERRTASAKARTGAPAPAPVAPATPAAAADDADKKAARRRERPVVTTVVEEDDEANKGRHHKKAGKAVKKADVPLPKKGSAVLTYLDDDYDDGSGRGRRKRSTLKINNKHGFKKPTGKIVHEVELPESISVSELASRMSVKSGEVIKQLMRMGVMATLNQALDQETAQLVVEEFGHTAVLKSSNEMEENLREDFGGEGGERVPRAPVVTVMGHVDHGKTSLLDYIRNTKVTAGEVGGITQHIGAYRVPTSHGELAFLDTPGHAAFTAMRARGARATDIVILVVAADDGVMPQTEEAIQHARAAGVPIVVAINKCDKPSADPDRVKNELVARNVIPDDWGGDTQFVHVSALTGDGIDNLLEAVSLQAELLELTAPLDVPARGVVIESQMDRGRGAVATVLIQAGQLSTGQILLAGQSFGRVRAMTNERGEKVELAGPSTPVEILGLDIPPNAGDEFLVVPDERRAREMAQYRADKERQERQQRTQVAKLENMFAGLGEAETKTLTVVLKTDVRGSLEAISAALNDLGNKEVEVRIVGDGVGGITENDINLALTSGAVVLGFNVRADAAARRLAEREQVEIRYYSIIYQLIDDVKSALSGMLDPERVEQILGVAEVRDVFRSPKFGQVAGCMVLEGTVYRNKPIRVLRENVVIFEGELESLRRFKDDVAEVRNGMECGIGVKNYDVKVGDQIEVFEVKEVARAL